MSALSAPGRDSADMRLEPRLGGLLCLRAHYVRHRFALHAHDEFAMGVIETGAQRVRHRGGHHIMPERTVCVINPGEPHTGHAASATGWTYSMIYPDERTVAAAASHMADKAKGAPRFDSLVIDDPEAVRTFLNFHTALRSDRADALTVQSLLQAAMTLLLERHARVRPKPVSAVAVRTEIAHVQEYLRAHFAQTTSLEELSGLAGLSPFHFLRSFTAATGMTPHAFRTRLRLARAKTLLSQGAPIAAVAAETGFADQSHLTHRFKAVFGVTPGHFQRGSRNLQDRVEPYGP